MKHLSLIASCAVCFMLGTLVPLTHTQAQGPAGRQKTYYNISFMKSRPGQDSMALERGDWATIHQDLVKSGIIKSWVALEPLYGGAHNYDYITIIAFSDMNAYNNIDYQSLFKKHWGDRMQSVLQKTVDSRDMIGNEIWGVMASVGGDQASTQ